MRTSGAGMALIVAMGLAAGCDRHKDHEPGGSSTTQPTKMSNVATPPGQTQRKGELQTVAQFNGPMPTGVTVSHEGRIFINFPKWGDNVDFTVAEVKDGQAVAYPDQQTNSSNADPSKWLISVQSVVVDPKNRLWALDTGSLLMGPVTPGGGKLVGFDLATNKVFKTIVFPDTVCLTTSYLNDVRFDLKRGTEGMAFITDSAGHGPNGIIVVDLASGRSWRKLNDHPSTKAASGFAPVLEGKPLMERMPGQPPKPLTMGSDGIAISADGQWLYYCPLMSRHLYRVKTDALADEKMSDEQVARTVEDLGEKPGASDGLESDAQGRIYATDYEHNAIHRLVTGKWETIAQDPRMIWPDTLSLGTDGQLYFTANQLNRQARFNEGKDLRQKPYYLFKTKLEAAPVSLK